MASVKAVGPSGQISLGKEYAGRLVLVDQVEAGVWIVKMGEFIPDSERWMLQDQAKKDIDQAVAWAEKNPPAATDLDDLESRVHS